MPHGKRVSEKIKHGSKRTVIAGIDLTALRHLCREDASAVFLLFKLVFIDFDKGVVSRSGDQGGKIADGLRRLVLIALKARNTTTIFSI